MASAIIITRTQLLVPNALHCSIPHHFRFPTSQLSTMFALRRISAPAARQAWSKTVATTQFASVRALSTNYYSKDHEWLEVRAVLIAACCLQAAAHDDEDPRAFFECHAGCASECAD